MIAWGVVSTIGAAGSRGGDTFVIQGREVRLPVVVRDATAAVAYYVVSAPAVQRLIEGTGLRVASVLPGRTLCTIGTMQYRDNDLGPYRELAVTFFVREAGERSLPFVGTAIGLLRGGLGAYIQQLPVDSEFSRDAGREIWGFPKITGEIAISRDEDEETTALTVEGRHVLRHSVRIAAGARSFVNRRQISYARRDGIVYRTASVMSGAGVGGGRGGGRLELGEHPIADELRSIGLPKAALFSTTIAKMTGTFEAATRLTV
jgi:hypothetical protein